MLNMTKSRIKYSLIIGLKVLKLMEIVPLGNRKSN